MIKLERQFALRLDELEQEFLTRYQAYLDRVIYLPYLYDANQVATMQLPMAGALARLLTDYAHEVFAVGQAHGDILCRELHKKYAPHKLADWQPSFQLAGSIGYDAENFWLRPEAALQSLEARVILLAGDVEHDILVGIKKIMLEHLQGATRSESEAALAKLFDGNMNRARLITTTETTYDYNRGRLSSFHANGVDYVRFSAVMDARTSAQCRSRHGKVMRLDSPELANNIPPLHGRCRSVLQPIYSQYQPEYITSELTDWSKTIPLPKGWKMDIKTFTTESQDDIKKSNGLGFVPARTAAEAQSWASGHNIANHVSYKGITARNVQVVNEWNQGIYEAQRRFPELRANFDFIGTCQERNKYINQQRLEEYYRALKASNPGATEKALREYAEKHVPKMQPIPANVYAQSFSGKHGKGISVNQAWGNDIGRFQAALRNDVRTRWHPVGCDTIKSVVDHELAHQIDDLLQLSEREEVKDLFFGGKTRILSEVRKEELASGLSRYSYDNKNKNPVREFVAEAWAEYCNNPEPRPLARQIGEIVEKVYKNG